MPRLILILGAAFVIWYLWQRYKATPPDKRRPLLWRWGFISLFAVAVLLVATGRMHWVGAALAALIPLAKGAIALLVRSLPLLRVWGRARAQSAPARIRTAGLDITINFANGAMDGEILTGPFTGKKLSELDREQLQSLLEYFRGTDRESALLLNAYLIRAHSGFWKPGEQQQQQPYRGNAIDEDEALQILGLEAGASREDVIKAHRRLIQKLHPDRGGSDYLASKINAAKDKLLETRTS